MTSQWSWANLPGDEWILFVTQGALIVVVSFAMVMDIVARIRAGWDSVTKGVTRGERSMATLTGVYAATLGIYLFTIEVAEAATGHKSFLVVIDVALIAYLFLFNNWFRNWLIGVASNRHQEKY